MALSKKDIKFFEDEEKEAENSFDFRRVADDLADAGDNKWAKKVYAKAEDKAIFIYLIK